MQYQVPVSNSQPLRAALQVLLCFCILLDTLTVVARGGYSCCSSSLTSPSCHCSSLAISCSLSQIMLLQTHRLLLLLLFPTTCPLHSSSCPTTWSLLDLDHLTGARVLKYEKNSDTIVSLLNIIEHIFGNFLVVTQQIG